MWPETYESWFSRYEGETIRRIEMRVQVYPILNSLRNDIAQKVMNRTYNSASLPSRKYVDYFNCTQFQTWLLLAAYREALRYAFEIKPIKAILFEMDQMQRRVLKWAYVDQLSLDELARMLKQYSVSRGLYDLKTTKKITVEAYEKLCENIISHNRSTKLGISNEEPSYSVAFPLPPCLVCTN